MSIRSSEDGRRAEARGTGRAPGSSISSGSSSSQPSGFSASSSSTSIGASSSQSSGFTASGSAILRGHVASPSAASSGRRPMPRRVMTPSHGAAPLPQSDDICRGDEACRPALRWALM